MHFEMAPNHNFMMNPLPMEPVSRTYQYRKIMKPMLERKRRARINKCLDELKDLMTGTLQADGENVSKLEKADILELTVRHLQRLRDSNALFVRSAEPMSMDKFWAGFQQCAVEVSQFLNKYDHAISSDLYKHIANYVPQIATAKAAAAAAAAVNYQRLASATTGMRSMPANLMFIPHANAAAVSAHLHNLSPPATTATKVLHTHMQAPVYAASTTPTPPAKPSSTPPACTHKQQHRSHPYAKVMKMEDGSVWRPW